MLSIRPFLNFRSDKIYDKLVVQKPKLLKWYCNIFIICSLVSIIFSSPKIIDITIHGNWYDIYNEHWGENFHMYVNQIDRFAKWVVGFTNPLAVIASFYFLTLKKRSKWFIILLFVAIILTSFQTAILTGTRGTLFLEIVKIFFYYVIFRKRISAKIKKYIFVFAIVFLVLTVSFSKAVTASRFEDESQSSLLLYFGESMLVFNYGLMDSIDKFMYGDFLFETFKSADRVLDPLIGTHFGVHFYTFVGAWYIDFGPRGTFLLDLFLTIILFKGWTTTQKICIADLLLYLHWLMFLTNGVFVIGYGYYFSWVIILSLFVLLKLLKI
jgi:oligosaccharide repeat unit polymerase